MPERTTVQGGLTLVETLVALVVLSVGLLGVAALQIQGISVGRTANYRTHAANLAADMAERIRSNPLGLDAYAGAGSDNGCAATTAMAFDCSPDQLAAHDLFLWDRTIRDDLPEGDWNIQVDSGTAPATYRLEVSWAEPRQGRLQHRLTILAGQR